MYQTRTQVYDLEDTTNESSNFRTLQLTHHDAGYLEVYVAEFEPQPGDKTAYKWKTEDGPQSLQMPPYSLTYIDRIIINVQKYAYDYAYEYLAELKGGDELVWHTVNEAVRYSMSKRVSHSYTR
jgi:hypothetical protein